MLAYNCQNRDFDEGVTFESVYMLLNMWQGAFLKLGTIRKYNLYNALVLIDGFQKR